jgi:hypothetical protein
MLVLPLQLLACTTYGTSPWYDFIDQFRCAYLSVYRVATFGSRLSYILLINFAVRTFG